MTTRLLALPAILVSLFAPTGCALKNDAPMADDKKAQKTPAELLVGKWKLVKTDLDGLPAGFQATFEFKQDGTVTLWKHDPKDPPGFETGTYRVEGNSLFLTMNGTDRRDRTLTIESITDEKLVDSGWSGGTRVVTEFERVRGDRIAQR